ncbi:MAG: P63C domain-containing protein, partial [Candidatus Binatia bacterium]
MDNVTGKAKGGIARAEALSPTDRKAIAKKAAAARWSSEIKQATHGSDDHPLRIGEIEIPCYVLKDETRVLSQRGLHFGLGLPEGGGRGGARKIVSLMEGIAENGIN